MTLTPGKLYKRIKNIRDVPVYKIYKTQIGDRLHMCYMLHYVDNLFYCKETLQYFKSDTLPREIYYMFLSGSNLIFLENAKDLLEEIK
jgi:hypothetical protein